MESLEKKRSWNDNVLWILFISTIILFGSFSIGYLIIPEVDISRAYLFTLNSYLIFSSLWVGVILTIFLFKKNRYIKDFITTKTEGNNFTNLIIGLFLGFVLNGFCALIAVLNGDFTLQIKYFEILQIFGLFIAVFVQSSAEELLCRGFLYQRLLKSTSNPYFAIIVNSLFFALIHLFNDGITFLAFYDLFIMGILFSFCVYYFDSLWMAMGIHATWNFTQSILLGLPNSGTNFPYSIFELGNSLIKQSFAYDMGFGLEGTILSSVLITLCCILLYIWKDKEKNKKIGDIKPVQKK